MGNPNKRKRQTSDNASQAKRIKNIREIMAKIVTRHKNNNYMISDLFADFEKLSIQELTLKSDMGYTLFYFLMGAKDFSQLKIKLPHQIDLFPLVIDKVERGRSKGSTPLLYAVDSFLHGTPQPWLYILERFGDQIKIEHMTAQDTDGYSAFILAHNAFANQKPQVWNFIQQKFRDQIKIEHITSQCKFCPSVFHKALCGVKSGRMQPWNFIVETLGTQITTDIAKQPCMLYPTSLVGEAKRYVNSDLSRELLANTLVLDSDLRDDCKPLYDAKKKLLENLEGPISLVNWSYAVLAEQAGFKLAYYLFAKTIKESNMDLFAKVMARVTTFGEKVIQDDLFAAFGYAYSQAITAASHLKIGYLKLAAQLALKLREHDKQVALEQIAKAYIFSSPTLDQRQQQVIPSHMFRVFHGETPVDFVFAEFDRIHQEMRRKNALQHQVAELKRERALITSCVGSNTKPYMPSYHRPNLDRLAEAALEELLEPEPAKLCSARTTR